MKKLQITRPVNVLSISLGLILLTIVGLVLYNYIPEQSLPENCKIDKILVKKSERKMYVFSKEQVLKIYPISLGFRPKGQKRFKGDGKTPEGKYFIISKNEHSIAYKSLGISYPNAKDKKYAYKKGKSAGGEIMIHGMMNGKEYWGKFHRLIDWTAGCIAVTNSEMDDLFDHLDVGCEIEILK